jgi:hypothetical protein
MLPPALIGIIVSVCLRWEPGHAIVFTVGLMTLIYTVSVWLGADSAVRLESPWIGVPIIAILCLILCQGHFVDNVFRPATLLMQILALSPFVAITLFTLLGLD